MPTSENEFLGKTFNKIEIVKYFSYTTEVYRLFWYVSVKKKTENEKFRRNFRKRARKFCIPVGLISICTISNVC